MLRMKKLNWGRLIEGAIVPVILLLVWQGVCSAGWVDPRKLPSPLAVIVRWAAYLAPEHAFNAANDIAPLWIVSGEFFRDAVNSLFRVLTGFAAGSALALPLGLAMGASSKTYRALNPMLQVLRPIPPIAWIPLAMTWFGANNIAAFFLIALGAFFPLLINTIAGVRAVDSIYLRAARNLGASQFTIFRRVILPAATPYILSGVRIGIGTAFIVVIVAEMVGVGNGLGFRILEAREYFWGDKIIAGMFSIGFLGLGIDMIVSRLNNHLLRWHRGLESS